MEEEYEVLGPISSQEAESTQEGPERLSRPALIDPTSSSQAPPPTGLWLPAALSTGDQISNVWRVSLKPCLS